MLMLGWQAGWQQPDETSRYSRRSKPGSEDHRDVSGVLAARSCAIHVPYRCLRRSHRCSSWDSFGPRAILCSRCSSTLPTGDNRQVAMKINECGGSTLSLGYAIADLATMTPFITSAGSLYHTMGRQREKSHTSEVDVKLT